MSGASPSPHFSHTHALQVGLHTLEAGDILYDSMRPAVTYCGDSVVLVVAVAMAAAPGETLLSEAVRNLLPTPPEGPDLPRTAVLRVCSGPDTSFLPDLVVCCAGAEVPATLAERLIAALAPAPPPLPIPGPESSGGLEWPPSPNAPAMALALMFDTMGALDISCVSPSEIQGMFTLVCVWLSTAEVCGIAGARPIPLDQTPRRLQAGPRSRCVARHRRLGDDGSVVQIIWAAGWPATILVGGRNGGCGALGILLG